MLNSRELERDVATSGEAGLPEAGEVTGVGEPPAGWQVVAEGRSLERVFTFANLEGLASFVQASLAMAVFTTYPLDMRIAGDRVAVRLEARDAVGLGDHDVEMAAVLSRCAEAASSPAVVDGLGDRDLDVEAIEEDGAMESDELARRAQERLRGVVAALEEVDRELAAIHDSLPEVPVEDAEAMEAGERPRSLLHFVRSMVEGMRVEELAALRETAATTAEKTAEELEAQWRTN